MVTPLYVSKHVRGPRPTSLADRSGKLGHDISAELMDIGETRIQSMDAAGIDVQVLSLTMPGAQAFDAANAPAIARDANDRMQDAITAHPRASPASPRCRRRIPPPRRRSSSARSGSSASKAR